MVWVEIKSIIFKGQGESMAKQHKEVKEIVEISMLRRITGYLVSDIKFWNSAKKAELEDRVKHVGNGKNGLQNE